MGAYWLLCLGAVLLSSRFGPAALADSTDPIPPFTGTSIPVPPDQNKPWAVPRGVPPALLGATITLYDQGLPDPRGCEYREITVHVGDAYLGDGGAEPTHGWVLPAVDGSIQRFAICWDGLIYPALSVGKVVDLSADANALTNLPPGTLVAPGRLLTRDRSRVDEGPIYLGGTHISERWLSPMKACLLLRLGDSALANQIWSEIVTRRLLYPPTNIQAPYLSLANDWTWGLYYQAVCAHMRGDDQISLLTAQTLTALQPKIEATASLEGFPKPMGRNRIPEEHYLEFLHPLPALLADEQRRVSEPPWLPAPVNPRDFSLFSRPISEDTRPPAEKTKRISALIKDLENVSTSDGESAGDPMLTYDPIVQALICEGDAAVEPLLDVMVNDTRLTRSVHFQREFYHERSLIGVSEAAYYALSGILQVSFFTADGTWDDLSEHPQSERVQIAQSLRDFWIKHRGQSLQDRYYQTLSDDSATPADWQNAADHLAVFGPVGQSGQTQKPTVTELMIKRYHQIGNSPIGSTNAQTIETLQNSNHMAVTLSKWDPNAAIPILREQFTDCGKLGSLLVDKSQKLGMAQEILWVTEARVACNDPDAIPDFVPTLQGIDLKKASEFGLTRMLKALWQHNDDPVMAAAARDLFGSPSAPLYHLSDFRFMEDLAASPLLGIPVFKDAVLNGLLDTTVIGTETVTEPGIRSFQYSAGPDQNYTEIGEYDVAVGTKDVIRKCDNLAERLQSADGMQPFDIRWQKSQRSRAIKSDIDVLRRYSERYAYVEGSENVQEVVNWDVAHMVFAPLTSPATEDDVKRGRAIFTLGKGAQVIPMASVPTPASLVTAINPEGYAHRRVTKGWIWQAEKDAHGNVFYGFVAPGVLAKEPASNVVLEP